jgi:hypothetical protein
MISWWLKFIALWPFYLRQFLAFDPKAARKVFDLDRKLIDFVKGPLQVRLLLLASLHWPGSEFVAEHLFIVVPKPNGMDKSISHPLLRGGLGRETAQLGGDFLRNDAITKLGLMDVAKCADRSDSIVYTQIVCERSAEIVWGMCEPC